jgi:hypothetical protein
MKSLSLLALLAAAAFTPAAFGQSANSTVTFTNFHYTLTDLTPDDGLAPSATFTFKNTLFVRGSDVSTNQQASSTNDVATRNVAMSAPGYNVSASTTAGTGQQHLNGASASASGSAIVTGKETPSSDGKQFNTYYSSAVIYDGTFILAPGTKITFYADVHAFASSDNGTTKDFNYAQATGWMDGYAGGYAYDSLQANAQHMNDFGLKTDDKTETLEISFTNYDFAPLSGRLSVQAYANGTATNTDTPLPVPEPSTYAMFLAGLGLIGVARRRRK